MNKYKVFQQRYPRKTKEVDAKGEPVFETRLVQIMNPFRKDGCVMAKTGAEAIEIARKTLACFRMPAAAKTLGAYPIVEGV